MTEKKNKHVHFLFLSENEMVGYSSEALNGLSSCLATYPVDTGETVKHRRRAEGFSVQSNIRNDQCHADLCV